MTANNDANLSTLIQRVESLSDAANDLFNAVREAAPPEAAAINAAVNNHNNDEQAHAGLFRNVEFVRKRFTDFQTNFYLSPNGVDADVVPDTPDKAWKTLAWAVKWIAENTDFCGQQLHLNLAPGEYVPRSPTGNGAIYRELFPNCGNVTIKSADPANKAVLTGQCFFTDYMRVFVNDVIFRGYLEAFNFAKVYLTNCDFEAIASNDGIPFIKAMFCGSIEVVANSCFMRGTWINTLRPWGGVVEAHERGIIRWSVESCELSGFSAPETEAGFISAMNGGLINLHTTSGKMSFLNTSGVLLRKFYVDSSSTVNSEGRGVSFFPGNKAGVLSLENGGIYI